MSRNKKKAHISKEPKRCGSCLYKENRYKMQAPCNRCGEITSIFFSRYIPKNLGGKNNDV